MSELDECPVCDMPLPRGPKNQESNEAHIAACISSRISSNLAFDHPQFQRQPEDGECAVCHVSFSSKAISLTERDREAHTAACLEKVTAGDWSESSKRANVSKNTGATVVGKSNMLSDSNLCAYQMYAPPPGPPSRASTSQQHPSISSTRTHSGSKKSFLSKLGFSSHHLGEKIEDNIARADELMNQRWGPPESLTREMITRYWAATRMQDHWEYLKAKHPHQFKHHLDLGYMEPIPVEWVADRRLACLNPDFSTYETPAEERLYYLLNNGTLPDGSGKLAPSIRPLNPNLHMGAIVKRGKARNARQIPIDPALLNLYSSPGDVFRSDRQIKSHKYSEQVPNIIYEARSAALHALADGIIHGTDHLETMLLLDVSGSMTWNPHDGIPGPDGLLRVHDQPSNILLVEHLVHRVLHHMIPRAQREHPGQTGIDTCVFSSAGLYVGQLSTSNFRRDWTTRIERHLGGGTQVMQGFQACKTSYFEHMNSRYGHGRYDPDFGWQPTPGMPKLSLLIFLDGEAQDMDEFELELLGETWAYVTIALVGMENCPHHHSHAIELERVAKFNPHVGFFDVHGRVCERLVVEDLLKSVYPVDPPKYEEILKPEYDIRPGNDELPAYS